MAAPSLPVSAAALRRADLLFKKGDQASAPREAAYALLNDEGGTFDGGALLKKCLAAVAQNPYGSLGLTTDATDAQIKKAYRKLALKLHPDKNPKTTPLFQAVKTAYDMRCRTTRARSRRSERMNPRSAKMERPSTGIRDDARLREEDAGPGLPVRRESGRGAAATARGRSRATSGPDGVGAIRGDKAGRGAAGGAAARARRAAAVERARASSGRGSGNYRGNEKGDRRRREREVIVGGPRRRNARENATSDPTRARA